MRTLIALFAVSFIAACATQAQRQYQQMNNQYLAAFNAMNNCLLPIMKLPVVERLNERFILKDINDPNTVQKLANKYYVTDQETEDLINFSIIRKPCHKVSIEEFGKVHPEYVVSLARLFTEADADIASAINKERTIGDFNRRTLDRVNQWQAEFTQIGQRITANLNQAHQYEMQQRQKAGQALQMWAYQQQQLNNQQRMINAVNMRRPVTTNCSYVGYSIVCRSF